MRSLLWQYRLWSFQEGDTKLEIFLAEISCSQRNYRMLRIGVLASCQKFEKLRLSENVNNNKCAPKFVLFNEKKSERFGRFLT